MPKITKVKCECVRCKKPIVKIGIRRKNGNIHKDDWDNRKYHAACYKMQQMENDLAKIFTPK